MFPGYGQSGVTLSTTDWFWFFLSLSVCLSPLSYVFSIQVFISCLIHIVAEFWHRLSCQLVVGFFIYQGWVDIWKVIFIVQDAFRNFVLCLLDLSSFFFSPMRLTCRPVDSPTKRVDPLLNSYSDYEDSVYGNKVKHCIFLDLDFDFKFTILKLQALLGALGNHGSLRPYPMMEG